MITCITFDRAPYQGAGFRPINASCHTLDVGKYEDGAIADGIGMPLGAHHQLQDAAAGPATCMYA